MPESNAEWPMSAVYFQAKALQVALTSTGCSTILGLKSALLVANYELGHVVFDAAHITVFNCSQLAKKWMNEQSPKWQRLEILT